MKVRFIRTGIIITIVMSAWFGIWMSGMGRAGALFFSVVGGILSMTAGMVLIGVKYEDDIKRLVEKHVKDLQDLKVELEALEEERAQDRREFGIVALGMSKSVADKVANRLLARHASNLHVEEQREAALKEADSIVAEEILSYGRNPKSK